MHCLQLPTHSMGLPRLHPPNHRRWKLQEPAAAVRQMVLAAVAELLSWKFLEAACHAARRRLYAVHAAAAAAADAEGSCCWLQGQIEAQVATLQTAAELLNAAVLQMCMADWCAACFPAFDSCAASWKTQNHLR